MAEQSAEQSVEAVEEAVEGEAGAIPKGPPKSPWHLWVVGIVGALWSAMGALDFVMTVSRNEDYMSQFTPEQLEFFTGFPAWAVVFWAVAVWGGVIGCVALLFRTRFAEPILLASLVSMLVVSFQNFVLDNGAEIYSAGEMTFSFVIFLASLGLWLYARAMKKRRVLA